jgi:uncharacterized protein YyaL (SSP411 family)
LLNAPVYLVTGADAAWAAGMPAVDQRPTAYFCRDFTCHSPVQTPHDLRLALSS